MKQKLFTVLLIILCGLFSSCEPAETPKDVNATLCLNALLKYFPYTIEDDFVFVNDSTGRQWNAKPYDRFKEGIFPRTSKHFSDSYEGEAPSESYGSWSCSVEAPILEIGVSHTEDAMSDVSMQIAYTADSRPANPSIAMSWDVRIRLSNEEYYSGFLFKLCFPNEVMSLLTDTLILPLEYQRTANGQIAAPEGSYARIVKEHGLTDFSVDGKSVWRRVKE